LPTASPTYPTICAETQALDVGIVVDSSCGITESECRAQQEFIVEVMQYLANSLTKFMYIEYDEYIETNFTFKSTSNTELETMYSYIRSRPCGNQHITQTMPALQHAYNNYQIFGRSFALDSLLVIQTCKPNFPRRNSNVCTTASEFLEDNINVFVVIGDHYGAQESSFTCLLNNQNNIWNVQNMTTAGFAPYVNVVGNAMCYPVTSVPTSVPTHIPTESPTHFPTASPTHVPTGHPTSAPTQLPTATPTHQPTAHPTRILPIAQITTAPSKTPTSVPTAIPSRPPTKTPSKTPTAVPTASPTHVPTESPTHVPTHLPTSSPTHIPTAAPTHIPTGIPTESPTHLPTSSPTHQPTLPPAKLPTKAPTKVPTESPTHIPTASPTHFPTERPTKLPTKTPSATPTMSPTYSPNCTLPLDIVFMVDISCEISDTHCANMFDFVASIVEYVVGSQTYVGLIVYEHYATIEFFFDSDYNDDRAYMAEYIRNLGRQGCGRITRTNALDALEKSILIYTHDEPPNRQYAKNWNIFLPVCQPNEPISWPSVCQPFMLDLLKTYDIDTLVVASGPNVTASNFSCLTNSPSELYNNPTFDVNTYASLLAPIKNEICRAPTSAPTSPPTSQPTHYPTWWSGAPEYYVTNYPGN